MFSRQPSAPVCHAWSTPVTTTQSPGPSGCDPSSRTRLTFPDRTTLKSTVSVWCIGISRAGSNSTRYQRASPGTDGVGSRSWCPIGRAGGGDSLVSNMRFNPTPGMNVRKSANSRSSTTHDFPSSSIPVISPRTCISCHSPLALGGRPRTEWMCQAQNYGWPTRLCPLLIGVRSAAPLKLRTLDVDGTDHGVGVHRTLPATGSFYWPPNTGEAPAPSERSGEGNYQTHGGFVHTTPHL
jgi:hypothetical protein